MEFACIVFAGLAIGDSGSNLSQIRSYEEPDDLLDQLAQPERISLTQKVLKLRAGGKLVPVHLTTTTLSRLRTYLDIRQRLVAHMGCADIAPMFVQCAFAPNREPIAIRQLSISFLGVLREKLKLVDATLPAVTLRQLRTFKQQHLVRKHGVKVASDVMGHSIKTAVTAYCNAEEDVRRSDMGKFLASLAARVTDPAAVDSAQATAIGQCANYGKPIPIEAEPVVRPDCSQTEGCFFCGEFRVHADEQDLSKLLSCRHVLQRLSPLRGDSASADKVFAAVMDRIEALLKEIRSRIPAVFEKVREDVELRGNLSRFWAAKLQQLSLLGMLATPRPVNLTMQPLAPPPLEN